MATWLPFGVCSVRMCVQCVCGGGAHVLMCKLEINVEWLPLLLSILFFEAVSLTELRAHQLCWTGCKPHQHWVYRRVPLGLASVHDFWESNVHEATTAH